DAKVGNKQNSGQAQETSLRRIVCRSKVHKVHDDVAVVGIGSADSHGQLNVVGERYRKIAVARRTYIRQIIGGPVGVVGDNQRPRFQTVFDPLQDVGVQRL